MPGRIATLREPAGRRSGPFKGWRPTIERIGTEGAIVSAFLYNAAVITMGSCVIVPAIILAIVGAAWLFGRAGERIGSLLVSRRRESAGDRDGERAKTSTQMDE
jgi:hypothetical protein